MKHTPWYKLKHNATITESTGTTFRYVAICGHERDIALIPVCDDQETADEIARLIAAAPEMLEALENIKSVGKGSLTFKGSICAEIAEAVIAKANL